MDGQLVIHDQPVGGKLLLGAFGDGNVDPWFVQYNEVNTFIIICYICVESNKPIMGFRLLMRLYVCLCIVQILNLNFEFE